MYGPEVGGEFAGYEVLSLLGKGGMGSVYGVRNRDLGRREALKVLSVDASGDFAARFAAEARTVASLDHPGIVTVYHHGITEGIGWFTMAYLEGDDLQDAGPMDRSEVATIVTRVADALDYAHSRNVVHRDIKPANIQVSRGSAGALNRVTVLDFGIARLAGATSLTAANSFIGTLTYMAPEILRGDRDVPAADQYSLACTAFELLTGSPPFTAASPAALMNAHSTQPAPLIGSVRPELAGLDHVFARALAKEPTQRYSSCTAFAEALTTAASMPPAARTTVAPAAAAVPTVARSSGPAFAPVSGPGQHPVGGQYRSGSHYVSAPGTAPRLTGPRPTGPVPQPQSSTMTVLSLIVIIVGLIVIVAAVALATL